MGEVAHDAEARARQPIDRPQAIIGRGPEGLPPPGDVADPEIGPSRLGEPQAAPRRISGSAIGGDLEVRRTIGLPGLPRQDRRAENREIDGTREELEGKPQPRLVGRGADRGDRQDADCEPGRQGPASAGNRAHGPFYRQSPACICRGSKPRRMRLAREPKAKKEEPRRGDCRGSYALHRTHYHPDKIQPGA